MEDDHTLHDGTALAMNSEPYIKEKKVIMKPP